MSFILTSQAQCRDCYKCLRHCTVKAIQVKTARAQVIEERCIVCGQCIGVCPQKAKTISDPWGLLDEWISQGQRVWVSLAPSYPAAFPQWPVGKLPQILAGWGLGPVHEMVAAADEVAAQHEKWITKLDGVGISSSCPVIVNMVEKYWPSLLPRLAPIVSPMRLMDRWVRQQDPQAKHLFIGPCLAKKVEAMEEGPDLVMTFAEVAARARGPVKLPEKQLTELDRSFALEGGLLQRTSLPAQERVAITGLEACWQGLEELATDPPEGRVLLELMACPGGCKAGPGMPQGRRIARQQTLASGSALDQTYDFGPISKACIWQDREVIQAEPSEEQLRELLSAMGKDQVLDELNCGACGYHSCREKARAVFRGLAEREMCIPYMRARAESIAHDVVRETPNGIIVVDEQLRLLSLNPAAEAMFQCRQEKLKMRPLEQLMDPRHFREVLEKKALVTREVSYRQYNLLTRQYLFWVEKPKLIIGIFCDVTREIRQEEELVALKQETIRRAGEVVGRQMRVAQEIAGLLGETTAETKVILDQLVAWLRPREEEP